MTFLFLLASGFSFEQSCYCLFFLAIFVYSPTEHDYQGEHNALGYQFMKGNFGWFQIGLSAHKEQQGNGHKEEPAYANTDNTYGFF